MALNLSSLQQKQDQLIYTIDEIVEWMRKIAGQTGYAQLQYYDRNGNLVTKNVPTIGQLIQQFQHSVNAQMAKTVYVDQVNGSDTTGDGSQNAPFKSLLRAYNSVPNGGFVNIVLLGDYNVGNQQGLLISNKYVRIAGASLNSDGSPRITLRNDPNSRGLISVGDNGYLWLDDLILECNDGGDPVPHWSTLLKVGVGKHSTIVIGHFVDLSQQARPVKINLNFPMLDVETSIANLILVHTEINTPNPNTNLITLTTNGKCLFSALGVLDVNGNVVLPQIGLN